MIDTQAPLRLDSSVSSYFRPHKPHSIHLLAHRQLVLDLLSVHLIRNVDSSVIISFHPTLDHPTTKADYLHDRIRFAGMQAVCSILLLVLSCMLARSKRVLAENISSFA